MTYSDKFKRAIALLPRFNHQLTLTPKRASTLSFLLHANRQQYNAKLTPKAPNSSLLRKAFVALRSNRNRKSCKNKTDPASRVKTRNPKPSLVRTKPIHPTSKTLKPSNISLAKSIRSSANVSKSNENVMAAIIPGDRFGNLQSG
jgi:hypothetical protein